MIYDLLASLRGFPVEQVIDYFFAITVDVNNFRFDGYWTVILNIKHFVQFEKLRGTISHQFNNKSERRALTQYGPIQVFWVHRSYTKQKSVTCWEIST